MRRRTVLALLTTLPLAMGAQADTTPASASVDEVFAQASAGKVLIVDVRTPQEWSETGVARGAVRLEMSEREFLSKFQALRKQNPDKQIALICRTGNRSGAVQAALAKVGEATINVRGGMAGTGRDKGWIAASLPVDK